MNTYQVLNTEYRIRHTNVICSFFRRIIFMRIFFIRNICYKKYGGRIVTRVNYGISYRVRPKYIRHKVRGVLVTQGGGVLP